jgi:dipeptidase
MQACTSLLVTKGASEDGSAYITYVADSDNMYGALSYSLPGESQPGTVVDWDGGKVSGTSKHGQLNNAVIGYMNEHQVSIGESTFKGRPELRDRASILDYSILMFLALQRANTAREAVEVMGRLVEEHGFSSTGETFSVSDPREAWMLEIVGKGTGSRGAVWVAVRIPDGDISAHANQSRIRKFPLRDPATCLYSMDVITFAREKGYFVGKDEDFSFMDAYAPASYETLRQSEARVWNLFRRVAPSLKLSADYVKGLEGAKPLPLSVKPDRKLSIRDVMDLMRDHYENTEFDLSLGVGAGPYSLPYRWHPLAWELDGAKYLNERPISTQQTAFSLIAQMRSEMPNSIGGILWYGVDDTYSTVYMPIYNGIRQIPRNIAIGTGSFHEFSWDSAFWVFNVVANYAYSRYRDMIVDIQVVQKELEGEFIASQPGIEKVALRLHQESPALANDYLTQYSASQVENTVKRWRKLWEILIVKYVDGNIKDEKRSVTQPGYPENWYRRIVQENGEYLRIKKDQKCYPTP